MLRQLMLLIFDQFDIFEDHLKMLDWLCIFDQNREKYTATMEKSLRKRVKIASAMAGIQVSTFIEEACKEKLEREGQ